MQGELKDAKATASKATSAEQDSNNLKADVDRLKTQLDEKTKQLQDADSNSASLKVRSLSCHLLLDLYSCTLIRCFALKVHNSFAL